MLLKKILLSVSLLAATTSFAHQHNKNNIALNLEWLNLKPMSNNHVYAYDVAGFQPFLQNWHAQSINPSYSSAFELGLIYTLNESTLGVSLDWIHLNSNDSSYKQGNQTTDLAYIEFVAPPFEMSPPVFGIRRADATLSYNFDDVALSLEKLFSLSNQWSSIKVMAGINVLHLKQNISTTFSDYVGSNATPYSYALPADPSYSFEIQSISQFMGAGPNLGLDGQLKIFNGLSLVGAAMGSLNVGTTSVQENFTATSANLTAKGYGVAKQQVTVPNKTQVVPGFDAKLGLRYDVKSKQLINFSVEGGYRLMTYANVISTINPQTLVQPGLVSLTPEFSTGTMAITSMAQQDRPFNLNGPYVALKLNSM